jgi:hypothetical protein
MKKQITTIIKYALFPLMISIYPSILHYADNTSILIISSFLRMAIFNMAIAMLVYIVILILRKYKAPEAALATSIFLVFFNTYGLIYTYLIKLDIFRIEHYTLLPLYILASIYAGWLITKISEAFTASFIKHAALILSVLIIFNLGKIVPAEITKVDKTNVNSSVSVAPTSTINTNTGKQYPDIYFLLFDEFAGFDSMRNYWQYNKVDDFVNFLKSKDFFVAEKSHGATIDTLQLMSSRLNYKDYPLGAKYRETYYHDIANNRVMEYLKSLGYTTIVFDETQASFAYPAKTQINADFNLGYKSGVSGDLGVLFDDYGILVADDTMLLALSDKYYKVNNPAFQKHRGMILYTIENISTVDISSPKFVYVHLMLPHKPFMFDENGNVTAPLYYRNWNSRQLLFFSLTMVRETNLRVPMA